MALILPVASTFQPLLFERDKTYLNLLLKLMAFVKNAGFCLGHAKSDKYYMEENCKGMLFFYTIASLNHL